MSPQRRELLFGRRECSSAILLVSTVKGLHVQLSRRCYTVDCSRAIKTIKEPSPRTLLGIRPTCGRRQTVLGTPRLGGRFDRRLTEDPRPKPICWVGNRLPNRQIRSLGLPVRRLHSALALLRLG